ncbi:hypothetical protein JT359_19670, partial [Candidatus Poribacteria bacterium]|nr:hypothetical protein [Candidatus Poribacteria bacterium]
MWARDESQVGSPRRTREQWIEVYNNSTYPISRGAIKLFFESHLQGSAPSETIYTDKISTYPSYTSVWDITDKGQHGNSDTSNQNEFISMSRKNLTGDGSDPNNWEASTRLFLPNYRGTPGRDNSYGDIPGARTPPGATTVAKDKIAINEIGKSLDPNEDWVELINLTGSDQSLKGWSLTLTTGHPSKGGTEVDVID